MADPFSVAAGAFGVISLAALLVEKAIKAKKLLNDIKEYPGVLQHRLDQLQLLGSVLGSLEASGAGLLQGAAGIEPAVLQQCHNLLDELLVKLLALTKDMKGHRSISRTALKAYLKREEIGDIANRLTGHVQILQLSTSFQQLSISASVSSGVNQILDIVSKASSEERSLEASSSAQSCDKTAAVVERSNEGKGKDLVFAWSSPKIRWVVIGELRTSYRRPKRRNGQCAREAPQQVSAWKWSFRPAAWAPFTSWQRIYKQYRVISADARIWRTCWQGNIAELRQCFIDGSATPYDKDNEGSTLLHVAASAGDQEVCRFLIENGADANEVDDDGETALGMLGAFAWTLDPQRVQGTLEVLVREGQSEPMGLCRYERQSGFRFWTGFLESFLWLRSQDDFAVDLDSPKSVGEETVFESWVENHQVRVDVLEELLKGEKYPCSIVRGSPGKTRPLLQRLFSTVNSRPAHKHPWTPWPMELFQKARLLLQLGAAPHTIVHTDETVLRSLLSCDNPQTILNLDCCGSRSELVTQHMRHCPERYRSLNVRLPVSDASEGSLLNALRKCSRAHWMSHMFIREWLVCLSDCGFDLKAYTDEEQRLVSSRATESESIDVIGHREQYSTSYEFWLHQHEVSETDVGMSWQCRWSVDQEFHPMPGDFPCFRSDFADHMEVVGQYCHSHNLVARWDSKDWTYTIGEIPEGSSSDPRDYELGNIVFQETWRDPVIEWIQNSDFYWFVDEFPSGRRRA